MSRVKTVTFIHETLQDVFNSLLRVGAADGDGGALAKMQAYIGLDRGAISTYISCSFVSVGIRLQQPRAAERRPGDKPAKIVELARCYCYIAPVCFRISNASFFSYARVL